MKSPFGAATTSKGVRLLATGALALSLGGIALLTVPAQGSFGASIKNVGNAAGSGTAFATIKDSGGVALCSSVPSGSTVPDTSIFPCSGSPVPATVPASAESVNLTLQHSGTQGFGSANVSTKSCYPRAFANSFSATNPLLLRYNVASNQSGPSQLSDSASAYFDGVSAQATANAAFTNPQTYTISAWFKTTAKRGTIVGFSSTANATGVTNYDRLLFVDNAGNVVWDTVPGGGAGNVNDIASSGTNYADGNWHFALGVAQASSPSSSISLYVDGQQVNTKTINQTISSEAYDGYWRIGYSPQDSRANSGGPWFNGNISNVAHLPSALSASQISTLWNAGSQSAYQSDLAAYGATAHWAVGAESTYTGTFAGGNNPCSQATLYVQGSAVGNLNVDQVQTIAPLALGASQSVSIGLATSGNYNSFGAGLHLDFCVNVNEVNFTQNFRWAHIVSVLR